jgi:hypothetical protein
MRPVLPNPAPTYQVPVTMLTLTQSILTGLAAYGVQPAVGNNTFNTAAVFKMLVKLTAQNAGQPKIAGLTPIGKTLVAALINYFTENATMKYGNARGALIDNYGQYCSYCGTPVQDAALAIEHRLPKSEFPSEMLYYANFFLACPSCNSYKGSQPNYAMSWGWANLYIATPPTTIQQVFAGGSQRQLWPNSGPVAWGGFPPYLWNATNGAVINQGNAQNLNNRQVSVVQNTVQASINGYAAPITVTALIGNVFNTPVLQQQETNFINIVQLNTSVVNVYSDRRVTNRTVVWLNVLASLRNLQPFIGTPTFGPMLQQIVMTAKSAGFYEIWSWLFYQISPPNVQNSVYIFFRIMTTTANQPLYYFPGTNPADLPTQ